MSRLAVYQRKVRDMVVRYRLVEGMEEEEKKLLVGAKERTESVQGAQRIVQEIASEVQRRAHSRIAGVVSRCLEAVFDEPYQFEIIFEQKRGKTEARLVFRRNGLEVDPLTASGGGVVDVAAFALRLACLMLRRPPLRRLLILDEPFKFVSVEYRSRLARLLGELAEEMGVQFLIVTHMDELRLGKVVELW